MGLVQYVVQIFFQVTYKNQDQKEQPCRQKHSLGSTKQTFKLFRKILSAIASVEKTGFKHVKYFQLTNVNFIANNWRKIEEKIKTTNAKTGNLLVNQPQVE